MRGKETGFIVPIFCQQKTSKVMHAISKQDAALNGKDSEARVK